MPTSSEILAGLHASANQAIEVAMGWHVLLAVALALLAGRWRPQQRTARVLLTLPLVSVAIVAMAFGNLFNAAVFLTAVIALLVIGLRADSGPLGSPSALQLAGGAASIAFGASYPHFLDGPAWQYLYAAPVGVVPCPTLALVCGFALLGGGLGSRAWSATLASLALGYGMFGVLRLGVMLDGALVAGGLLLAVMQLSGDAHRLARGRGPRAVAARG